MNDFAAETNLAPGPPPQLDSDRCVVAGEYPIPNGARSRTALLLAKVGGVLTAVADKELAVAGLDGRDYAILAILAADDPSSQYELAQLLGKAPAAIVAAVDRLEQLGLVQRTRDPADRRRTIVALTRAGIDALDRADELAQQTVASVLNGLDRDELEQLRALLVKGLGLGAREQG